MFTSVCFALLLTCSLFALQSKCDFNPFEENLIFSINWAGPLEKLAEFEEKSSIVLATTENEKYHCILPAVKSSDLLDDEIYDGPSAVELLEPLITSPICIHKIDVYWSYELCHGSYLRQFHEERQVGKQSVLQEYYLGTYSVDQYRIDVKEFKNIEQSAKDSRTIPKKKVDVLQLPYITINMTDGSNCDLNGKPRSARILYVCYPELQQEIYSFEEVSICEYELLVLTSLLCDHPDYRIKKPDDNEILCHSLASSPRQPLQLKRLERNRKSVDLSASLFPEMPESDDSHKQTETKKYEEYYDEETLSFASATVGSSITHGVQYTKTASVVPLPEEFLGEGKCFHGGSGWWLYEYCPGVKVEQYHKEANGKATTILLGKWDKLKHLEWVHMYPQKKPKKGLRRHISHLYSEGNFCELVNKPRQVEVKLRCKESEQQTATSMYLREPSPCEYILVVESSSICSLIEGADENGLISV